jgi:hypothetical protein
MKPNNNDKHKNNLKSINEEIKKNNKNEKYLLVSRINKIKKIKINSISPRQFLFYKNNKHIRSSIRHIVFLHVQQ